MIRETALLPPCPQNQISRSELEICGFSRFFQETTTNCSEALCDLCLKRCNRNKIRLTHLVAFLINIINIFIYIYLFLITIIICALYIEKVWEFFIYFVLPCHFIDRFAVLCVICQVVLRCVVYSPVKIS